MAKHDHRPASNHHPRGVIAVQVGVMLTVLLGVAALTVDVGQMYAARSELQRARDAAALAGASAYTTEEMMMVRMAKGGTDTLALIRGYAQARAQEMSSENNTLGAPTLVDAQDITPGWLNVYSATEPIVANPDPTKYNAVRVVARRQEHSGPNGPVPLFFAPILGKFVTDASASAVAVFDDRVSGFDPAAPGAANLLPFTISEKAYYSELASGSDSYSYDDNSGAVSSSPDGIREIRLYPYPLSGSGYTEGDGNFERSILDRRGREQPTRPTRSSTGCRRRTSNPRSARAFQLSTMSTAAK